MSGLALCLLDLDEANTLVARWHRHHKPAVGHRFSLGAVDAATGELVGACIVGRPVARMSDQRNCLEVTRLVTDGHPNACSFLYGAAARVAKEMGAARIQTYVLDSETGVSLRAAGWVYEGKSTPSGAGWQNRPGRRDDQPTCPKGRWARVWPTAYLRPASLVQGGDKGCGDATLSLLFEEGIK